MNSAKLKTLLERGVEEVIERKNLEKKLNSGKKLRIKLGIDPTSPDLHLGHAVLLRKLRQFQDAGHKAVLIIGDATAMVGDPSGRNKTRPSLKYAQVKKNFKEYLKQVGKIINVKKAEIQHNSKWFNKKAAELILQLAGFVTAYQLMHRADFKKRSHNVTLLEMMYPLWQGYDSVAVKADVEIGGTDQKFNLLMGRQIQKYFKMPEQDVLMTPLIEGTDGVKKMSKSYGNYIALNEKPDDMFGKVMSLPDKLMSKYFETLTDLDVPATQIKKDPRGAKLLLAKTIVAWLHSAKAAEKAEKNFIKVFSKKEKPEKIPEAIIKKQELRIVDLLTQVGVKSRSEARRLIEQGGVRIDGEVQKDANLTVKVKKGTTLRIGKRRFFKLA